MEVTFKRASGKLYPHMVVQLGRIGDVLNVIPPCWKLGLTNMMVSRQYADLFTAFTYITPHIWDGSMEDLAGAVRSADYLAEKVYVPQLFGLNQPPNMPPRTRET